MQTFLRNRQLHQSGRVLIIAIISIALLFCHVLIMNLLQSGRDETRQAEAALLLDSPSLPDGERRTRWNHALDLYRRGLSSTLILVVEHQGAGDEDVKAGQSYLRQRGIPESAILLEQGQNLPQAIRAATVLARQHGIGSVLLVTDAMSMLRGLKITSDFELDCYASPPRVPPLRERLVDLGTLLPETWGYLRYIFTRG